MSLGNRIKTLRKAQNLTQQKLADKVEVSRIYVQALESNRRLPSMKLLQRLAPALNVDVTDLLMDFSSPDNPGRVQLESMLDNGELEIWYRSKKLTEQELKRVYRLIEALLMTGKQRMLQQNKPDTEDLCECIPSPPEEIPHWAIQKEVNGRD
jgi:Predicted transcriptional regulators